jgi:hypothetical protein
MSTVLDQTADLTRPTAPPPPLTMEEVGLVPESVDDLLLKLLYVQGAKTGREITEALALPFDIVDARMLGLQESVCSKSLPRSARTAAATGST